MAIEEGKRKVVGRKQTLRALQEKRAVKVYVASDAEERVIRDIVEMCKHDNIQIVTVESMEVLGKKCGIDVGASVVTILD